MKVFLRAFLAFGFLLMVLVRTPFSEAVGEGKDNTLRGTASEDPGEPNAAFPDEKQSGDFTITPSSGCPSGNGCNETGDGEDEWTEWSFQFQNDPDLASFKSGQRLKSARLALEVSPKHALISTDTVEIVGLRQIRMNKYVSGNSTQTVSIDLLDYYSAEGIIGVVQANGGAIPMFYQDDAIVLLAKITLIKYGAPDLSIRKTAHPDPVTAGGDLAYTLAIANRGPGGAENVLITDSLPSEVTFKSFTLSQGSCSPPSVGGLSLRLTFSCNLGDIPDGGLAQVVIHVAVSAPPGATFTNFAAVSGPGDDPVNSNDTDFVTSTVAGLSLSLGPPEPPANPPTDPPPPEGPPQIQPQGPGPLNGPPPAPPGGASVASTSAAPTSVTAPGPSLTPQVSAGSLSAPSTAPSSGLIQGLSSPVQAQSAAAASGGVPAVLPGAAGHPALANVPEKKVQAAPELEYLMRGRQAQEAEMALGFATAGLLMLSTCFVFLGYKGSRIGPQAAMSRSGAAI